MVGNVTPSVTVIDKMRNSFICCLLDERYETHVTVKSLYSLHYHLKRTLFFNSKKSFVAFYVSKFADILMFLCAGHIKYIHVVRNDDDNLFCAYLNLQERGVLYASCNLSDHNFYHT